MGSNALHGRLLHFREIDEEHRLPPGTAAKHLVRIVTEGYPIKARSVTANTARFAIDVAQQHQDRLLQQEAWEAEHGV